MTNVIFKKDLEMKLSGRHIIHSKASYQSMSEFHGTYES